MASPVVAIDGPVGAGKTTVGRLLSRKLGYRFLDTGVMYRALTWLALDRGMDLNDEGALGRLAWETSVVVAGDGDTVVMDGREVSSELRQPQVERMVSLVSKAPEVRSALVEQQRAIAKDGDIVMVGRDIGTVVLPSADRKVYLVASVTERARRRHCELVHQGYEVGYDQVVKELEARDEFDSGRAHSPLQPASDAVIMDTNGIDVEQVAEKLLALMGEG